jgi:hypothetical protein
MIETPPRRRLHSVWFYWYGRIFAMLLAGDAVRVIARVWFQAEPVERLLSGVFHAIAFALLAYFLWTRGKTVIATDKGLELGLAGKVRVVPWERVASLREMPWMSLHPPWYPKLYQLDFSDGESLDFVGRRDARAIVSEWVA